MSECLLHQRNKIVIKNRTNFSLFHATFPLPHDGAFVPAAPSAIVALRSESGAPVTLYLKQ